jgi:hypothetical protein
MRLNGTKRSLILSVPLVVFLADSRAIRSRERTESAHLVASERCSNFSRLANALRPNDLGSVVARSRKQNPKILERQRDLLSAPDQCTFKMGIAVGSTEVPFSLEIGGFSPSPLTRCYRSADDLKLGERAACPVSPIEMLP